MPREHIYSPAQWDWIAARRQEGYRLRELADILDLSITAIHLNTKDRMTALPPLEARLEELYALWDKESL